MASCYRCRYAPSQPQYRTVMEYLPIQCACRCEPLQFACMMWLCHFSRCKRPQRQGAKHGPLVQIDGVTHGQKRSLSLEPAPNTSGLTMTAEWHYVAVYPSTPHLRIPEALRPGEEKWVPDINNVIEAAWLKRWNIVEAALDRGYPVHAGLATQAAGAVAEISAPLSAPCCTLLLPGAMWPPCVGCWQLARIPMHPQDTRRRLCTARPSGAKAVALAWLLAAGGDPGAAGLGDLVLTAGGSSSRFLTLARAG